MISKQKELVEKNIEESNEIIKRAKDRLSKQKRIEQLNYEQRILKVLSALEEYNTNGRTGEDKIDIDDLNLYQSILKDQNHEYHNLIAALQRASILRPCRNKYKDTAMKIF